MTITTFEEQDETAQLQSEPSSPILGGQQELPGSNDFIYEMKFEMRSTKDALPSSGSVHERLKSTIPNASASATSSVSPRVVLQNHPYHADRLPLSDTQTVSRHQHPVQNKNNCPLSENLLKRPKDQNDSRIFRSLSVTPTPTPIPAHPVSTDPVDGTSTLRSRLRRQRRMLSQNSSDQPEDPMERLNRLRARISGALSEVKGVLNKYSTEMEPNESTSTPTSPSTSASASASMMQKNEDSGPVQFRFIKKVRRRSIFNDDDDKQKGNEVLKDIDREKSKSDIGNDKPIEKMSNVSHVSSQFTEIVKDTVPIIEVVSVPESQLQKRESKNLAEKPKPINNLTVQTKTGGRRVSIGTIQETDIKNVADVKTQRRPSDSTAILKNLPKSEFILKQTNEKDELRKDTAKVKKPEEELANNKATMTIHRKSPIKEIRTSNDHDKLLAVKGNENLRRSSINTVESLKMKLPNSAKHQRRPSDSAAILEKCKSKSELNAIRKEDEENFKVSKVQIKSVDRNSEKNLLANAPLADKKIDFLQTAESKNSFKDGAVDKQSAIMPNNSVPLIVNEIPIPSSESPSATLATHVGRVDTKNLQLSQLSQTSDDKKSLNFAVPSSLLQEKDDAISQLNQISSVEKSIPTSATQRIVESPKDISKINKPIKQQNIIPVTSEILTSVPLLSPSPSRSPTPSPLPEQQSLTQQVGDRSELADIAIASGSGSDSADDICMPDIYEKTSKKSLSEVNVAAAVSSNILTIPKAVSTDNAATVEKNRSTKANERIQNTVEEIQDIIMPELQVHAAPVKAVTIHLDSETEVEATNKTLDVTKEVFPKKKIILKKIQRKSSTEKPTINNNNSNKGLSQQQLETTPDAEKTVETSLQIPQSSTQCDENENENENEIEKEDIAGNRERKVKKKVIIKRVQRRLSGSDQTFFIGNNDEKSGNDVETLEKAIAYVTDDEIEDDEDESSIQQDIPLKSCMRIREYQIGDLVLYGERYKKTQIRWKKGRVIERITSISYKIDLGDGKVVSPHIKDLKKYTGRKVRFGDKEYLEIDYEQIAEEEAQAEEEERKSRNYSIWNLV